MILKTVDTVHIYISMSTNVIFMILRKHFRKIIVLRALVYCLLYMNIFKLKAAWNGFFRNS